MPDPLNSQAFNRYMFCYGNPISFIDVNGFESTEGGNQGTVTNVGPDGQVAFTPSGIGGAPTATVTWGDPGESKGTKGKGGGPGSGGDGEGGDSEGTVAGDNSKGSDKGKGGEPSGPGRHDQLTKAEAKMAYDNAMYLKQDADSLKAEISSALTKAGVKNAESIAKSKMNKTCNAFVAYQMAVFTQSYPGTFGDFLGVMWAHGNPCDSVLPDYDVLAQWANQNQTMSFHSTNSPNQIRELMRGFDRQCCMLRISYTSEGGKAHSHSVFAFLQGEDIMIADCGKGRVNTSQPSLETFISRTFNEVEGDRRARYSVNIDYVQGYISK